MRILCGYSVEDYGSEATPLETFAGIPFGLSYIATALKASGHEVRILVTTHDANLRSKALEQMEGFRPGLICLTAVTSEYPHVCALAREFKRAAPSTPILLGGHHATLSPRTTLAEPCFDAICIGEGEKAVVEYAEQIEQGKQPSGIHNLWIKRDGGQPAEENPTAPFMEDLDALPFIDRGLWHPWVRDKTRMFSVLLGRGCPNSCSYCSNHALRRIAEGRYLRLRRPEGVIQELNEIQGQYPNLKSVYLEVETFGFNMPYVHEMCERLVEFNRGRRAPISFGTNVSLNRNLAGNPGFLKKLRGANFGFINIGLESGSERIRREILRRPAYTNQQIIEFCRMAKELGIEINMYVLLGLPEETMSDFRETVAVVRACDPASVLLSIFYPYPGTDLYRKAREMGLFSQDIVDPRMERRRAVLDLPAFSRKQIQRERFLFPYRAYRGRKPLSTILAMMLRDWIAIHSTANRVYRRSLDLGIVRALKQRLLRVRVTQ